MKSKHTPGPWKFTEDHSFAHVTDRCGQQVAKVWLQGDDYSNVDARLIAAAPEMLEALETSLSFIDAGGLGENINAQAKATLEKFLSHAIAKARGEK